MRIYEGAYLDYAFLFGDERTATSDCVVRQSLGGGGGLLVLTDDGHPGGYLAYLPDNNGSQMRLYYLYVAQARRGRGLGRALFAEAARRFAPLWAQATEDSPAFPIICHLCEELGFVESTGSAVFHGEGHEGWQTWRHWYERQGQRYESVVSRLGFEAVSFAEAPAELLEQVKQSHESEYEGTQSVLPFFSSKERRMDWDKSFLAHMDGKLAAFSVVSALDKRNFVFEYVSAAQELRGKGVMFLPLVRAANAIAAADTPHIAFAMYDDNTHAHAFRRTMLSDISFTVHRIRNFRLYKPWKEDSSCGK